MFVFGELGVSKPLEVEKRKSSSPVHSASFYRRRYPVQSGISKAEGTAVDPHNLLLVADPAHAVTKVH
jgi:hypothetical protein